MRRIVVVIALSTLLLPSVANGDRQVEDIDLEEINNCLVLGPHSLARLLTKAAKANAFDLIINSSNTLGEVQFLTFPGHNNIQGIVFHDPGSEDLWFWNIYPFTPVLSTLPVRSSLATRQEEHRSRIVGRLVAPVIPEYLQISARAEIHPGSKSDKDSVEATSRCGKKFWIKFSYMPEGPPRPRRRPYIPYYEKPDPKWVTSIKGRSESTPFHFVRISRRCSIPDIIEAI